METAKKTNVDTSEGKLREPFDQITDRETEELVIGFCGAAGSGTTRIAEVLKTELENRDYDVDIIKLSAVIEKYADISTEYINHAKRIETLQKEGTNLRIQYGSDILAMLAIKKIRLIREQKFPSGGSLKEPQNRRYATIIDSLKHPDEEKLLRKVYGDMFYLFGVLCPEEIRIKRLEREKKILASIAHEIVERDKAEEEKKGQQLLDTIHLSDFFFRNTDIDSKGIRQSLVKFVNLILGDNKITPSEDEYGMAVAYVSSLRSGCISRQVGASIIKDGDIISTGRNDVPKYKGGLYRYDDQFDGRCFSWDTEDCRNEKKKKEIKNQLLSEINEKIPDKYKIKHDEFNQMIKMSNVGSLTEYSRSIHAEMDAITSIARNGHTSAKGSTLYCTTYPCHNCARHIVASGITRVFYIEPYEKSLATELHNDSISTAEHPSGHPEKLEIIAFEGVGPRQYSRLYRQPDRKDKETGRVVPIDTKKSKPCLAEQLDRFTDYEARIVEYLTKNLKEKQGAR